MAIGDKGLKSAVLNVTERPGELLASRDGRIARRFQRRRSTWFLAMPPALKRADRALRMLNLWLSVTGNGKVL